MVDDRDDGGAEQRPDAPASSDAYERILAGHAEHGDEWLFGPEAKGLMANEYNFNKAGWVKIKKHLRQAKVLSDLQPIITAEAAASIASSGLVGESANEITVKQSLGAVRCPEPPDCSNCLLPYGYVVRPGGRIEKEVRTKDGGLAYTEVVSAPVFVNRLFMRRGTEAHEVELVWLRGKRWKRRVIKRSQMSIGRQLAEVSEYGLPVINAGLLAEYLVRFEQTNLSRLRSAYTTAQLGWISEGNDPVGLGFQAGDEYIRAPNAQGPDVAPSAELNVMARKVRAKGSLEKWGSALRPMAEYRSVWLAVYAALVSPMLRIFDWKNACLEWASPTSEGKSTVIQFLMSVWQSPHDDIPNWNSTGTALERVAASMNDCYLALDDTATAGPQNDFRNTVQSAIYMLVAGMNKFRGKADGGLQDILSWRLFVVTSGEVPTGELGGAEGAAARILSITAQPLGPISDDTGRRIAQSLAGMEDDFGVAGPAFIRWLMGNRDKWPQIREIYERCYAGVSALTKSGAGNRASHVIALLEAAAWCAHQALPLPWPHVSLLRDTQMINILAGAIQQTKDSSSKTASVYEQLMSFVGRNPDRFWRDDDERIKKTPTGGWVGRNSAESDTIDFHTDAFKELCSKWKVGERVVLRSLSAIGKLRIRDGTSRNAVQERVGAERFWFYKIVRPDTQQDADEIPF